jgi:hypothetical protein
MNVDEGRVLAYQRLMQADRLLAAARARRAPDAPAMSDWADPEELDREVDLYLTTLARYVASLGGRVEVRAVFGDEDAVTLLTLPDDAD